MQNVLLVVHLIIALVLIGAVMMQRSEGGALGIGGGGPGGSGSLFSSRGVGNTLTRATAILAVCFFVTSIALTLLATRGGQGSALDGVAPTNQQPAGGAAKPAQGGPVLPNIGQDQAPAVPTQQ
jgi:preprotein translocase subunit SecG